MGRLEKLGELETAPLRGPAELRRQLMGWEPALLDALLAPKGTLAELVAVDPEVNPGDFDQRAYRRGWLTLTTEDGRGLVPGTRGRVEVRPGTVAEVFFCEVGRVDGPAPQVGLERIFLRLLGPDVEQWHAELSADIAASGDPAGRRAFEPAGLDASLRRAFWRFYGFRQSAREQDVLSVQLSKLVGLDDEEGAELNGFVASVRDLAFREGTAIGAAWEAHRLQHHLGGEIAAHRRIKGEQSVGGSAGNASRTQRALRIEQALYAIWRPRRAEMERRKKTVDGVLTEIFLAFEDQQAALPAQVRLERPKKKAPDAPMISPDRGRRMLKAWKDGHNPVESDMTWEAYCEAKKAVAQ